MKLFVNTVVLFTIAGLAPPGVHSQEGTTVTVPQAPAEIDDKCNGDKDDFCENIGECQAICVNAACCGATPEDDIPNCFSDNISACASYAKCAIMRANSCDGPPGDIEKPVVVGPPNEIPRAPGDLEAKCNDDGEDFCTKGVAACLQACGPAACCLATDETNCAETNAEVCLEYLPCESLIACGDISLPIGPPDGTPGDGPADGTPGNDADDTGMDDTEDTEDMDDTEDTEDMDDTEEDDGAWKTSTKIVTAAFIGVAAALIV